ncbi:HMA5 [Symbiodinium sp. CCMP2456]|nr:HMA5 [Symbiodinium sp. CCMP2456]
MSLSFDDEEHQLMSNIVTVPGTVADPEWAEPEQREIDWSVPDAKAAEAEGGPERKQEDEDGVGHFMSMGEYMDDMDAEEILAHLLRAAGNERDDIEAVSLILATRRVDVNTCNEHGITALYEAVRYENLDIVKLLLDSRADVEASVSEDYFIHGRLHLKTASDLAAAYGNLRAFKALRDHNASVSATTLASLLRGEGPRYTEAVEALLTQASAKAQPGQARLREHLRVLLLPSKKLDVNVPGEAAVAACQGLHEQNLFYAAEVGVTLLEMPLLAPVACERMVLAAVAETANEEIVASDTVDALIAAAWLQMRASTALDILLMLVSVVCLCLVSYAYRHGGVDAKPALWILAVIHTKEALEWLLQAAYFFWSKCCGRYEEAAVGLESLADLLYLVTGYLGIVHQMELQELERSFLPVFSAMAWLRLLYSLRGERWLGPRLLPILSAVRDTQAFFLVTVLCLASATHAYFILNPRGEDPLPIYSSFTHTARLGMFGDFDLFEYQGQDTTFAVDATTGEWVPNDPVPDEIGYSSFVYLQVIFFFTGVGITILLMNLLIGVLGQNYEIHMDRAHVLFVRARAKMLLEHRGRPQAKVKRRLCPKRDSTEDKASEEEVSRARSSMSAAHWCMAVVVLLSFLPVMLCVIGPKHWEAVLGPLRYRVFRHSALAFVLFLIFPVILALSLALAVPVALVLASLWTLGFHIQGMQYAINFTLFNIFGNERAAKCTIYAMVRTESGVDELRGMRTDLKDKMQKLEDVLQQQHLAHKESLAQQKDSIRSLEQKLDKILALLMGEPKVRPSQEELGSDEPDLKSAEFSIRGMTCAACSGAVQKALESIPGVEQVEVSLLRERADVTFNANVVNPEQLCSEIEDIGFEASLHQVAENKLRASAGPRNRRVELSVGGMTCAACSGAVERALRRCDGVLEVQVSLLCGKATLVCSAAAPSAAALAEEVDDCGFEATVLTETEAPSEPSRRRAPPETAKLHLQVCGSSAASAASRAEEVPGVMSVTLFGSCGVRIMYRLRPQQTEMTFAAMLLSSGASPRLGGRPSLAPKGPPNLFSPPSAEARGLGSPQRRGRAMTPVMASKVAAKTRTWKALRTSDQAATVLFLLIACVAFGLERSRAPTVRGLVVESVSPRHLLGVCWASVAIIGRPAASALRKAIATPRAGVAVSHAEQVGVTSLLQGLAAVAFLVLNTGSSVQLSLPTTFWICLGCSAFLNAIIKTSETHAYTIGEMSLCAPFLAFDPVIQLAVGSLLLPLLSFCCLGGAPLEPPSYHFLRKAASVACIAAGMLALSISRRQTKRELPKGAGFIILNCFLYSATYRLDAAAVGVTSSVCYFAFSRLLMAAVCFAGTLLQTKEDAKLDQPSAKSGGWDRRTVTLLLFVCVVDAAYMLSMYQAVSLISPVLVSAVKRGGGIVVSALFGALFFGENLSGRKKLLFSIAAGVTLLCL